MKTSNLAKNIFSDFISAHLNTKLLLLKWNKIHNKQQLWGIISSISNIK